MAPAPRAAIGAPQLDRALGDWQRAGQGPAYRALAGGLRTLVLDGRVPVETRLPAERELSAALGVSRTTVAAAYELLRDEGFLASRRGAGSWTALPAGRPMPVAGLSPFPTDGGGVIDLGVAAMSAPEPWLSEAMAHAVAELSGYTRTHGDFPAGLQVLRQAVADRYAARGLPTAPEQIMITSGAAGGLSLLLRQLLGPAERVAVESPSYANALQAFRFAGGRAVPVPLLREGWDLEAWSRTLRDAAPRLAYTIPDFHNPSGLLMSEEERRELVAAARSTGTLLIADETMAELCLDPGLVGSMPRPMAAFDHSGCVVTLGSAGKTFWGGLRIGWIRATAELVRRLAADRASLDVSSPVVEQLAVARLLDPEVLPEVLDFQRERVRAQRDALVAAMRADLPDWNFRLPSGGLSLWVRTGPGLSGSALATTAQRHGVWIGSGPRFGVDGVLERFVRLPFAQPAEVSREAVRRLAAAAATLGSAPVGAATPTSEVTLL
ncbi:MocR-like transcription factor YczR [Streptacidiphilus rugosus]|uniref:MocR-like transcription factor YczR n=1 Tax=Streptacidiphilus rugosus TaxID=405783 RepID=UPI00055CCBF4|nr:PLP-dependent aminotransferase family protein [Streptacidiphilus rugosus]